MVEFVSFSLFSIFNTNMAKRFRNLNPEDQKNKEKLLNQLRSKGSALNKAIEKFNSQVEDAIVEFWENLEVSIDQYNGAVVEANEFIDQVAKRQEEYYKSCEDKWREGSSGDAYQDWITTWTMEVDQIALDCPTFEGIEEVEINIEAFDDLPDKVDS